MTFTDDGKDNSCVIGFFNQSKTNEITEAHSQNTPSTEVNEMKDIAITENHLYQKAYQKGERAVGKNLAVYVLRDYTAKRQMLKNPQKKYINRIGLSVSKKIGGAVERNRTKRIIRAGLDMARREGKLKTGFLIVIAARVGADTANSGIMARELIRAFEKLGLYEQSNACEQKSNVCTHKSSDGIKQL